MARAPEEERVAREVTMGGEFRTIRDSSGKDLSDYRLIEFAKPHHPWVRGVYDLTSGWIHFSREHVSGLYHSD